MSWCWSKSSPGEPLLLILSHHSLPRLAKLTSPCLLRCPLYQESRREVTTHQLRARLSNSTRFRVMTCRTHHIGNKETLHVVPCPQCSKANCWIRSPRCQVLALISLIKPSRRLRMVLAQVSTKNQTWMEEISASVRPVICLSIRLDIQESQIAWIQKQETLF